MAWHSVIEAAHLRKCTRRQIYRLISSGRMQAQPTSEGTCVWLDEPIASALPEPVNSHSSGHDDISIPAVSAKKMNKVMIDRVKGMLISISAATNVQETEARVASEFSIPAGTQRRWKLELRSVLKIPGRSPLHEYAAHPKIREALEYVIVRRTPSNKGSMRRARELNVIVPATGEVISCEEFLKSLYGREGVNARSCYLALKTRCLKHQVLTGDGSHAALESLPTETSVRRFLHNWRVQSTAARRARSRRHDWETGEQPYVTRDVTQFRPGELWIGDHCELDFMVLNESGRPDRRWISAFIDIRTGLLSGYHMSWQPSSETVALAFRTGVLGSRLNAFTEEGYKPIQITNVPEVVMLDNGKDYRSNYTKRIFGKIDFEDSARLTIQRLTRLHYVLPYHAQSKAQMERWFGVIQSMLKHLPGYKGNKYENKPDDLKADLKQNNILTVDVFDRIVSLAINAYNNRVRRSLNGQSPLQNYLTHQTHQRSIDLRVLDFLLMKVKDKPVKRCQIKLFGCEYYSDALLAFNDKRADVYYDPTDLGFVAMYVDGEFAAVASNKEMMGVDERGWLKILRDRKRSESELQSEIRTFRKGIPSAAAKMILLEGELSNVAPVPAELMEKRPLQVTTLTGLEDQARELSEKIEQQQELAESEKKSKRKQKQSSLSLVKIRQSF